MEQTLKQQEQEVEILIEQECQLNKLRVSFAVNIQTWSY